MALPQTVIKRDHDLEQDFENVSAELMEHRWHWTYDETNLKRVSVLEYARAVGRSRNVILDDARGWAEKVAEDAKGSPTTDSGKSVKTPNEYREKAHLGNERHHAAEAIAKVTGNTISTVSRTKREEITAIVGRARERAEKRGTNVKDEIDHAVEYDAKAAKARAKDREEHAAAHTFRYVEIEGHLGVAMQRLRKVLDTAKDVGFTDDEIELIADSLGKLRALMNLIDLRIVGDTDIDWDSELAKLGTDK